MQQTKHCTRWETTEQLWLGKTNSWTDLNALLHYNEGFIASKERKSRHWRRPADCTGVASFLNSCWKITKEASIPLRFMVCLYYWHIHYPTHIHLHISSCRIPRATGAKVYFVTELLSYQEEEFPPRIPHHSGKPINYWLVPHEKEPSMTPIFQWPQKITIFYYHWKVL